MRYLFAAFAACFALPALAADFPKFKMQEIDTGLKIGYAVITVDIDGDKKPDIVVVDQHKVVWYKNPGKRDGEWKKYTILDGKTKPTTSASRPSTSTAMAYQSWFWVPRGCPSTLPLPRSLCGSNAARM
jgi:hypothetical protein